MTPDRPPTVSILVPTYQHATTLPACLDAIRAQSRPADEVIVLDDGSTDDTAAVLRRYRSRVPGLRLLRHDRNRGLPSTIDRLVAESTGDYLVCAAADDTLLPSFVERSLGTLERHPEIGLCCSEFLVRGLDGSIVNRSRTEPALFGLAGLPEVLRPADLRRMFRERYLWMSSNTVMVNRSALLATGGFPRALEWYADWFAFYVVALRHGVCPIAEPLAVISESPAGYSGAGRRDWRRQRAVLQAFLRLTATPAYRDVRRTLRAAPAIMLVLGSDLVRVLVASPRHWDVLAAYAAWYVPWRHRRGDLTLASLPRLAARLVRGA